jgi:hypothetical protein
MSTIVTRSGKGSPLTHTEVDNNFTNLNADKTENASAAITGGSINNTVIGNVTPNAGTFTTLTATGQTSLGGAADANNFRVYAPSGVTRFLNATGTASGDAVLFADGPVGSTPAVAIYSRSTGVVKLGTAATNGGTTPTGTVQFQVSHTASAVNFVQVTGAATGSFASISAQGSDAITGLGISSKGAARINFFNNNSANRQVSIGGNGAAAVNFIGLDGSIAGSGVQFSAQGSDTNISQVFQSKGTGAINLAPGSRGVNISNGGTVTAITRAGQGSGYTSIPSVAISPPTTAGGVQATATANMFTGTSFVVTSGGTGYTVGNVVTLVGGTPVASAATVTVTAVSGGVVTAVTPGNFGAYSSLPPSPTSVTGGSGTGLTLTIQYGFQNVTITNAGSGYVEQPTVTFSGGGGSGAVAYATVGGVTELKFIGTGTDSVTNQAAKITTSAGTAMTFRQISGVDTFWQVGPASGTTGLIAKGNANGNALIGANGSGSVRLTTNGDSINEQLRVAHTASAVNFVQVTGAATGTSPQISSQGSDANIGLQLRSKGTGAINLMTQGGLNQAVVFNNGNGHNFLGFRGGNTGVAPLVSAEGSDTNIDLALTPKGTGLVRFGTYTANMALTVQGFIEVKDSGGTIRKLAVIA